MRNRDDRDLSDLTKHGPLGSENYRNQLGRSDEMGTRGAGDKRRVVLVYAGATNARDKRPIGDSLASALCITTTYDSANNTNNIARPLDLVGVLRWGVDGHQSEALFDWLNGTTVHVVASFVEVIAQLRPVIAAGENEFSNTSNALMRAGAFVGYFSGSRVAPTMTQQVLVSNLVHILEIPEYARALAFYGDSVPTNVQWAIGPAAALAFANVDLVTVPIEANGRRYPRPGVATHLVLTAAEGQVGDLWNCVWELCL